MKMKVPARALQSGDKVGSGEVVVNTYEGLYTPSGKIEVKLRKSVKDGNGQFLGNSFRYPKWNKTTIINVERD